MNLASIVCRLFYTYYDLPYMHFAVSLLAYKICYEYKNTVGCKIIRALEIVRVKKLISNAVL